jgi:hypothetical protein
MKKRSILDELSSIGQTRDLGAMIASRADHIVTSVRNLREFIHEHYDAEQAQELERVLLNSIRTGDSRKFQRNLERKQNHT